MAYFPYGGKSIFYEEFGQGSPVLFLHGNTASSRMFELLVPLYAEKFRCIFLFIQQSWPLHGCQDRMPAAQFPLIQPAFYRLSALTYIKRHPHPLHRAVLSKPRRKRLSLFQLPFHVHLSLKFRAA